MTAADDFGAYVPGARCRVAAAGVGALNGLTFAVKDLIDVAGYATGGGNPDWAAAVAPAARHAPAVALLLAAGAAVNGKCITDELAFSLEGDNWHYGTPRNPRCPDCLPGGSSSGSAVAVAAGLADFALGTDTGGSVRVPAAFCGVFGMRPSHGAVPLDGVLPFAPDYDTVGWFAADARVLERVGKVLLGDEVKDDLPAVRLLLADDVFALTEPALAEHLRRAATSLGAHDSAELFAGRHHEWLTCYQTLQGAQVRDSLGEWIASAQPRFGPSIAERFASLASIDNEQVQRQQAARAAFTRQLEALLQPGVVLVMPTTPTTALPMDASEAERGAFYGAALAINAIAGHAGLPQLTIPAGTVDGKPAALSFVAARGADQLLLRHAHAWAAACHDDVGAWTEHGRFVIEGSRQGPLAGLTFAAKDVFDVAGHATGAGNPTWLATHPIPRRSSPIVDSLLEAGATLVGKSITDELAYSIHGDNAHYGTPVNSAAPGRVPGGSSSGSAAAAAAGLCDFALATDTGGSTRVPASYCGLWGLRTTHDLLPRSAMVPLNPGFDTPTWLARHAAVFRQVADVLLPFEPARRFRRVLMLDDVLAEADPDFAPLARRVFDALGAERSARHCAVAPEQNLESWREVYVTASAYEAWQVHGAWIEQHRPAFGAAVATRFAQAREIGAESAAAAQVRQRAIRASVRALLGNDGVAVLPSAASVAPSLNATSAEVDQIRSRTFRITCVAGLAGLPQVSMPFRTPAGLPVGISLLGPAGSDRALVELATTLWQQLHQAD